MFTPDDALRLADIHIKKYERMIASSGEDTPYGRSVNVSECNHYLRVWKGVKDKGGKWIDLAPFERQEVLEALADEADDPFAQEMESDDEPAVACGCFGEGGAAPAEAPPQKLPDVDQFLVQLAGCSVAALGGTSENQVAHQGDYGWSPAYQDVLNLRTRYDLMRAFVRGLADGGHAGAAAFLADEEAKLMAAAAGNPAPEPGKAPYRSGEETG